MHAISLVFPTLGVFTSFSFSFFCTPVPPLRFTSSCTVFILLYFAVIICCQVRLPVFVTCARVYLKTILYCFPVYVRACVDDQYLVRASSVVTLRKHSSDGRFKRDVLKLFGRTKCPRYIFFFVVTTPASSTHVHFLSFFLFLLNYETSPTSEHRSDLSPCPLFGPSFVLRGCSAFANGR